MVPQDITTHHMVGTCTITCPGRVSGRRALPADALETHTVEGASPPGHGSITPIVS